ncbi:MAG: ABC transporter substrate-binding protein [Clostridiales Family XIII bacterium]|jgi:ABC-type transport system substrate-binding protein|nr:ABC transporter substrate-binding protein [Clostridiales Family XIII bacterium]
MKVKKAPALLLALVLAVGLLAGCNNKTENSAESPTPPAETPASSAEAPYEPADKAITVGVGADPRYWDPWGDFNNGRQDTIPMVYQALAHYVPDLENNELNEYLVLAESYENVSDGVYEVVIREGITDTAGHPFTADDAVFCFDSAAKKGIWWELNAVDRFETVSEYVFRVYTNDNLKTGDFQNILTNFPMVTRESYEASSDEMITSPVGTTGYVLAEYVAGSHATFKKAGEYWNDAANESKNKEAGYCPIFDCTKLDTVRFEIVTDASAMSIALESGAIDIASNLSVAAAEVFTEGANAEKFSVGTRPGNQYGLSFNVSKNSPTNNYNLRMALAHCVDAEGVLKAAFNGSGIVLKAWSFPTYIDWQNSWDADDYFEYDPNLAKEYLDKFYEETGTTADTLKLRLLNQSGAVTGKIGEAVQSYIVALVGNPNCVEMLSYDRPVYEPMWEQADAFDLLLIYAQTISRISSAYTWNRNANAKSTMSGNDLWHANDAKAQELLNEAIGVDTHSDRTVAAFQAYINEKAYMKNLICGETYIVGAGWISGLDNCAGYKDALALLVLDYDWSRSGR